MALLRQCLQELRAAQELAQSRKPHPSLRVLTAFERSQPALQALSAPSGLVQAGKPQPLGEPSSPYSH